ncbi:LLM class flavin-dependent oxidoreductase [Xanthobacter sp. V4C-4]|uniref:LLM class flavin-dependent oxidoreductase n=1 Tax=Xanthobacter cornucopiae TaxID=3119924 RepID=UPI00372B1992
MSAPGLILNVAVLGLGMHLGGWRKREGSPFDYLDLSYYQDIGRIAERGKLHAVFLADTLAVAEENFERPNLGALDPAVTLAAVAASTRHVGLVATASTTYNEPYNLARRTASLDHLSGGRAAWNIVTTFVPDVAANFGGDPLPLGPERYARAEEFVDVVLALWDSWKEGALIGDKAGGRFVDRAKVAPIDHVGRYYSVRGPLTLPRSPQGRPVLFQAGSSQQGRQLAARVADAVFTVHATRDSAAAYYADMKRRAAGFGRAADSLKILPGIVPVLGSTVAEARQRKAELDALAGDAELRKLALRVGVRVSDLDLDKPLPFDLIAANGGFRASEGFRSAAVELGRAGPLTVRQIVYENGGGHIQVVGTPEQVADTIEDWYRAKAADGFNLMIDTLPSSLDDFVDSVVPILQKRGVFRTDFAGTTLRANLGLETLP